MTCHEDASTHHHPLTARPLLSSRSNCIVTFDRYIYRTPTPKFAVTISSSNRCRSRDHCDSTLHSGWASFSLYCAVGLRDHQLQTCIRHPAQESQIDQRSQIAEGPIPQHLTVPLSYRIHTHWFRAIRLRHIVAQGITEPPRHHKNAIHSGQDNLEIQLRDQTLCRIILAARPIRPRQTGGARPSHSCRLLTARRPNYGRCRF